MPALDEHLAVFLNEIKDDPADDTPRLILADWLQDQGDPRGEFIFLQVSRERLNAGDQRVGQLYHRERQLLHQHAFTWLGPLADIGCAWSFVRGFIRLGVRAATLPQLPDLRDHQEIVWLESLKVHNDPQQHNPVPLVPLARAGLLQTIVCLDLTEVAVTYLPGKGPSVTGLRELLLGGAYLGEGDRLAKFAGESSYLAKLNTLALRNGDLRDHHALALAESPHFRNLRRLDVTGNRFTKKGKRALSAAFRCVEI